MDEIQTIEICVVDLSTQQHNWPSVGNRKATLLLDLQNLCNQLINNILYWCSKENSNPWPAHYEFVGLSSDAYQSISYERQTRSSSVKQVENLLVLVQK